MGAGVGSEGFCDDSSFEEPSLAVGLTSLRKQLGGQSQTSSLPEPRAITILIAQKILPSTSPS